MDNAGVQKEHRDHTRLYTLGPCTHVKIEMHSHEQHGLAIVFNQLLNPACAIIFTITTGHGSLSLSKSIPHSVKSCQVFCLVSLAGKIKQL